MENPWKAYSAKTNTPLVTECFPLTGVHPLYREKVPSSLWSRAPENNHHWQMATNLTTAEHKYRQFPCNWSRLQSVRSVIPHTLPSAGTTLRAIAPSPSASGSSGSNCGQQITKQHAINEAAQVNNDNNNDENNNNYNNEAKVTLSIKLQHKLVVSELDITSNDS